jgi:hypothetical protein
VNFPIKDMAIRGDLIVKNWQGAWLGALRNAVSGNLRVTDVTGVAMGEFGPDSNEVSTNTVFGNLICQNKQPRDRVRGLRRRAERRLRKRAQSVRLRHLPARPELSGRFAGADLDQGVTEGFGRERREATSTRVSLFGSAHRRVLPL